MVGLVMFNCSSRRLMLSINSRCCWSSFAEPVSNCFVQSIIIKGGFRASASAPARARRTIRSIQDFGNHYENPPPSFPCLQPFALTPRPQRSTINFQMGTLHYGDNLVILRRYLKDESVDFVYLDKT